MPSSGDEKPHMGRGEPQEVERPMPYFGKPVLVAIRLAE